MTIIRIIAFLGLFLAGVPLLVGVCCISYAFVKHLCSLPWDERLVIMFQIGCIMLITAAVGSILIKEYFKPITADASTDTQQEIPPQVENCNQEELPQ